MGIEQGFSEKDWKLFRKKAVGWQEAFMERLNREYIELLNTDEEALRTNKDRRIWI